MVYYTLRCDHRQYQEMVLYTIRAVKMGLDLEFELIGMDLWARRIQSFGFPTTKPQLLTVLLSIIPLK